MVTETTVAGQRALTLESEILRVTLLPDMGAKVISLVEKSSQHEWLSAPPGRLYRDPFLDADTVDYMHGGWDECFPSVAAGFYPSSPWSGSRLADHGELWSRAWQVRVERDAVVTSIHGVRFPYRFERRLSLAGATVRSDYELTNLVEFPFSCMWAMHPLFAAEAGLRLVLPSGACVTTDFCSEPDLTEYLQGFIWPVIETANGDRRDLSTLRGPDAAFAVKLFTERLSVGRAALHDTASDRWLGLSFDSECVPYLGIWINEGAWPPGETPLFHVALEPSTGRADHLDAAMRVDDVTRLGAHETMHWRIQLEVGEGAESLAEVLGG